MKQINVAIVLLITLSSVPAIADAPAHTVVRLGEQALAFSSGFIRTDVPVDGVVVKTVYNRQILGQADTLYLRSKQPDQLEVDTLFTVYRRIRKVFHPAGSRYLGNLYAVLGVVRVVKTDGDIATAKIERAYGSIYPGDSLMSFELPHTDFRSDVEPALPDGPGMIVDVQHPHTLVAQYHIIYLDWGHEDGLRPGDRLQVLRRRSGFPVEPIGEVKVLNVEATTATAVVLRSVTPVAIGDLIVPKDSSTQTAAESSDNAVATPPQSSTASRTTARAQLRKSLAAEIAKGDVSVTEVGDKMTISLNDLVDQLEYEPGEAHIKPAGIKILHQISEYLKQLGDQQILVEGHTDNMAIGPTLSKRYRSNKELSEARAKLIVRYFQEAGIDPASLAVVGYAETRPVATNATEEGRRKNRRIELVLTPKAGDPTAEQPKTDAAKAETAPEPHAQPQVDTGESAPEPLRVNLPQPLDPEPRAAEPVGDGGSEVKAGAPSRTSDTTTGPEHKSVAADAQSVAPAN